ncbi:MAG: YCF48-related protein, partial [Bryobacteraceae bacterium]
MALCFAALAPLACAQTWKLQYFYDQEHSNFFIDDLAFPSAQRGIAVGRVYDALNQFHPVKYAEITTSDGGEHWSMEPLKDRPRSLFFLNDSTGWMVTDNAIWVTDESGRAWKKIADQKKADRKLKPKPPDGIVTRVWFLDALHGFAIGLQKTALETQDGGRTWTQVAAASEPAADPSRAAYTQIVFDGRNGLIAGSSTPTQAEDSRLPAWMNPEREARRAEIPEPMLLLQTRDGGAHWQSSPPAPLLGALDCAALAGPNGLAVFGSASPQLPSEVYAIDTSTGKMTSTFKVAGLRITDCALFSGPRAFLAAVEPAGKLSASPIPGKVRIFTSADLQNWTEMKVDYRANAR